MKRNMEDLSFLSFQNLSTDQLRWIMEKANEEYLTRSLNIMQSIPEEVYMAIFYFASDPSIGVSGKLTNLQSTYPSIYPLTPFWFGEYNQTTPRSIIERKIGNKTIVSLNLVCKAWYNILQSHASTYYPLLWKIKYNEILNGTLNKNDIEFISTHLNVTKTWKVIEESWPIGNFFARKEDVKAASFFPTFSVNNAVISGRYYYEVKISVAALYQIGWISSYSSPHCKTGMGYGVGDDNYSWAFDGYRLRKWGKVKKNGEEEIDYDNLEDRMKERKDDDAESCSDDICISDNDNSDSEVNSMSEDQDNNNIRNTNITSSDSNNNNNNSIIDNNDNGINTTMNNNNNAINANLSRDIQVNQHIIPSVEATLLIHQRHDVRPRANVPRPVPRYVPLVSRQESSNETEYGTAWKEGDIIGCSLDADAGIISWSLNGKDLGIGFELGDFDKNILPFYPAVSLGNSHKGVNCQFYFNKNELNYLPSNYLPLGETEQCQLRVISYIADQKIGYRV